QSAFQRAFPDWKFNLHEAEEQGDIVTGAVQITGTHTQDLVLPGMPPIPATHKKVSLPEEHLVFTFKGDRIASLASDNVPGGGVAGVLQQIGVPIPAMSCKEQAEGRSASIHECWRSYLRPAFPPQRQKRLLFFYRPRTTLS